MVWHLLLIGLLSLPCLAKVFDIRSFGAVGDGRTPNTRAIQGAIAAAHAFVAAGGGPSTVLVTAGVYVTGSVALLSGVTLNVTPSGTLFASSDKAEYPQTSTSAGSWAVVLANDAVGVGVVGGGKIAGDIAPYISAWDERNIEYIPRGWAGCQGTSTSDCRPKLLMFISCRDVVVHNITLDGSPFWTFHLLNSSRVFVSRLTSLGDPRWPNNDGLDVDSSQHVLVEDSRIDVADDGFCVKSTAGMQDTVNVTGRRLSIRSRSSAIKIGSATQVGVRDLLFEDVYIWDSNVSFPRLPPTRSRKSSTSCRQNPHRGG